MSPLFRPRVSRPYRKLGWKKEMNIFRFDTGLTPFKSFFVACCNMYVMSSTFATLNSVTSLDCFWETAGHQYGYMTHQQERQACHKM